jgi:GT2 family glycosyltransferase
LRLSEIVDRERVVHIPRVLYHWRAIPASAAESLEAKPYAAVAGRRAVAEALERRKLKGTVSSHAVNATTYRIELRPQKYGKVSVFIPTRDACEMVRRCIEMLRRHTEYPDYEIVVIDNQSTEPELHEYLGREESAGRLRTIGYDEPFNHSRMHNIAAEQVDSTYMVLLNNDVEITSDRWLEQMVAAAEIDPVIAGVGALLVYPDGLVQHGGLVLGVCGVAGRSHNKELKSSTGYFCRLHCLQEVSAVTGAMMLLRRSAFLSVGGFNAERYPTTFNDVDLWIRMRKAGYRCVYDPTVEAIHHECKTRKHDPREHRESIARFRAEWAEFIERDPFYNPNLPFDNEQFHGRREFPVEAQIRALCPG